MRKQGRPQKVKGKVGRPKLLHNTQEGYRYLPRRPSAFTGLMRPRRSCTLKASKLRDALFCNCLRSCGSDCLNRCALVQCDASNCGRGGRCGNRPFIQCTNLKEFQVQDTAEKGQGLFCKRQFKEGSFVLEYVGEVRSSQDDGSGGHSAYRMMVDDLTVIDGIDSGHPSRFINHSCEPNLECQRWCVGDHTRVGFFAARDIERGAELTFDYDFESGGFKCNCGAATCKGWVGKR
jgi:SET domain-containing protein